MYCLFENVHTDRQYTATTGFTKAEFKQLLVHFERVVERSPQQRPGPQGCLTSLAAELFFALFYLKTYPSFDVLGLNFGIEGPAAYKRLHQILVYLRDTLKGNGMLPARSLGQSEEVERLLKGFEDGEYEHQLWIDATERRVNRPQCQERQKTCYSGKKGFHTHKNLLLTSFSRYIIFISFTQEGSHHDYRILKEQLSPEKGLFKNLQVWLDSGFQGFAKDYAYKEIHQPHKRPRKSKNKPNPSLSEEEKKHNQAVSKVRVLIENAIGGLKRYQILVQRLRNRSMAFADEVVEICAGLWNFKTTLNNAS